MPFLQIITDLPSVPEAALFERLRRVADWPSEARSQVSVQLRDPQLPARERLRLGRALREATRVMGASLVVNDRADLAVILGADGLHLGRGSMTAEEARELLGPEAWISMSAHSVEDVVTAARAGASAALLSPIFASPGKGAPLGVGALSEARAALAAEGLSIRLFALGGVTAVNAGACFAAGAEGVAAIRADFAESVVSLR